MSPKILLKTIKETIKLKSSSVCLDNWAFKLHYRLTTSIFFVASVLVTSREYIGEHIKCVSDNDNRKFEKVVETFCFFSTTFTVIPNYNVRVYDMIRLPYPGVLPFNVGLGKDVKRHMYYQWVPFLLFGQGVMFFLTHIVWKNIENGRIRNLTSGLNNSVITFFQEELQIGDQKILKKEQFDIRIKKITKNIFECTFLNRSWTKWFVLFEIINFLHLLLQIYITNAFLGGHFYTLGIKLWKQDMRILDRVFPKVTKCSFHQYGRSGSIENHDALCIMALNIINEKVYIFLWFWFVVLLGSSCLILTWRFFTMLLWKRCKIINYIFFGAGTNWKTYPLYFNTILQHCTYSDWLFLRYVGKNVNSAVFKELLDCLFDEIIESTTKCLQADTNTFKYNK